MSTKNRRGFTLAELLVVAVVGSLVVGAAYGTLVRLQRGYTVQSARIANQQTLRAALDFLTIELRQVSSEGGDILGLGSDTLSVRSMNALGVACDTATSASPTVTARRIGGWLPQDSVFVFRDGDPVTAVDDAWRTFLITDVDTTATCVDGSTAQRLTLAGMTGADTVKAGAALRTFERLAYGIYEIEGHRYLARRAPSGVLEALVGPFDDATGDDLSFSYVDAFGNPTATPEEVAQVRVLAELGSRVTTMQGAPVADSVEVRINIRN